MTVNIILSVGRLKMLNFH